MNLVDLFQLRVFQKLDHQVLFYLMNLIIFFLPPFFEPIKIHFIPISNLTLMPAAQLVNSEQANKMIFLTKPRIV